MNSESLRLHKYETVSPGRDDGASCRALVEEARRGCEDAFEDLVRCYGPVVTAYLHGRVSSPEECEDLYQEVFVTAFYKLDQLRNPDRFGPWLLRIARSKFVDYSRNYQRRKVQFAPLVTASDTDELPVELEGLQRRPDTEAQTTEICEIIEGCIGKLRDRYRVVVALRIIEDMPASEIASRLSLRGSTVRMRLKRGLQTLRKRLQAQGLHLDIE